MCVTDVVLAQSNGATVEAVRSRLTRSGSALLIGAHDYRDTRWPRLPSVTRDIDLLQNALTAHFEHIEILQNPSAAELRQGLESFLRRRGASADERLFIFYAGHGISHFNDTSGDYEDTLRERMCRTTELLGIMP
jgi:hypothetical protein